MIDKTKKDSSPAEAQQSEPQKTSPSVPEQQIEQAKNTELSFALEEMEHVIAYLCRTGGEIDTYHIDICIEAKHKFNKQGFLTSADEIEFWAAYRMVMESIKPATLASIQETNPSQLWMKKNPKISSKVKRMPLYYGIVVCCLIVLTIVLQIYYMIGIDVLQKTYELFNERSEVRDQINKLTEIEEGLGRHLTETNEMIALKTREAKIDQEFDANRILMFRWNKVWQFGSKHQEVTFSAYDDYKYQEKQTRLNETIQKLEQETGSNQPSPELTAAREELRALEKDRMLSISRHLFFSGRLSAVYVVNLLEGHVLPLLFGCLGAFTLVLRSMHEAFYSGTFTLKSCLDYNLRILLGGVIGISSGMFMADSKGIPEGDYSPMVLAFLVGYNVEIMFSIMDSLAQKLMIRNSRGYGRNSGGCRYGMGGPQGGPQGGPRGGSGFRNSRDDSVYGNSRMSRMSTMSGNTQPSRMNQSSRIASDQRDSRYRESGMLRGGSRMSRGSQGTGGMRGPQTSSVYGNSRMSRMSRTSEVPQGLRRSRGLRSTSNYEDTFYQESSKPRGRSRVPRDSQGTQRSRGSQTDSVYGNSRMSRMSRMSNETQEARRSRGSRLASDYNDTRMAQNVRDREELQDDENRKPPRRSRNVQEPRDNIQEPSYSREDNHTGEPQDSEKSEESETPENSKKPERKDFEDIEDSEQ